MGSKCCPFGAPGLSLQPPPGKKKGKEERREGGGRGEKTEGGGGREKKREREKDTFTKGSIPWLSSFSYNLDSFYATLVYWIQSQSMQSKFQGTEPTPSALLISRGMVILLGWMQNTCWTVPMFSSLQIWCTYQVTLPAPCSMPAPPSLSCALEYPEGEKELQCGRGALEDTVCDPTLALN